MPYKPNTICNHPGCGTVCKDRYCEEHKKFHRQIDRRKSARQRGYTSRWDRERKLYLYDHPFCARCGRAANVIDHIIPHKGNQKLFWDYSNWQPLCKECHDTKTATEDGGFGRARR